MSTRVMDLFRVFLFAAAAYSAGFPALAQTAPAAGEPWGYLYFFRTQKLFSLTAEESRIGRLTENEVVLVSPRVSRRHAAIRRTAEGAELVDVGSTNGTKKNGEVLPPRSPVPLAPGDRIELAEEAALFHRSLPELWRDELRHRLLAGIVNLRHRLPQDRTRKAFGREEIDLSVSEVRVNAETGAAEIEHSAPLDSESGFPEGSGAFVGSVAVEDGALVLSLWTIAATGESMTSRRASFTNLKHAALRISIVGAPAEDAPGPWFPPHLLAAIFDVFPDTPEFGLQFAVSLANQERSQALADAAASLSFRHQLDPNEWKLLLMAAQAKGLWVDRQIDEKGLSLDDEDKAKLEAALEEARSWVERARALGAKDGLGKQAEALLASASERLSRIQGIP